MLKSVMSRADNPDASACVVNSLWSHFFGSDFMMPTTWERDAVQSFGGGATGRTASLTEVVRTMLKSPYGKARLSPADAPKPFEQLVSEAGLPCTKDLVANNWQVGWNNVQNAYCDWCHTANFGDPSLSSQLQSDADLRKSAACKILKMQMPQHLPADPGLARAWAEDPKAKASVLCALAQAKEGDIPKFQCGGTPTDTGPHAILPPGTNPLSASASAGSAPAN